MGTAPLLHGVDACGGPVDNARAIAGCCAAVLQYGRMKSNAIDNLRALTRVLDDLFGIPGTRLRFGLDSVLGLVPGVGDIAGGALSMYALLVAHRMGAPPSVLLRIAGNIVTDMVVGTIPLMGDLFDVGFKANRRNLAILERYDATPRETVRGSRIALILVGIGLFAALVAITVGAVLFGRWLLDQL